MRTYGLVSICLLCLASLAGCGNDDEIAAKVKELKDLRTKYKALNLEKVQKHPERLAARNAVMPAKAAAKAAARSGDKGKIEEAQAALADAEAAANVVIEQEKALGDRITAMRDKMGAIEKEILKLGGRVPKAKK